MDSTTFVSLPLRRMKLLASSSPPMSLVIALNRTQDEDLPTRHPMVTVLLLIVVLGVIIVTLVGNAMVCLAILMVRKLKQQPSNLLLISLAIADFSVGLFVMPLAVIYVLRNKWVLGEVVCRLWTSADLMLCTASILNLCMISVDRYMVVTRPLRYAALRTRRRILSYIAIVWIGALFVSVAPLVVLPWNRIEHSCQVPQNQMYQIYAMVISFYGPCLIMVILYIQIWRAARRLRVKDKLTTKWSLTIREETRHFDENVNELAKLKEDDQTDTLSPKRIHRPSNFLSAVRLPLMHTRSTERGEDKARKTLGIIMSVFIICWLPFFVLTLLKSQRLISYTPDWLDDLVLWLGYSNSMLNPLIYAKYNREFRIPFKEMLSCRFRSIQVVMRNESFRTKFGGPRFRLCERNRRGTCGSQTHRTLNGTDPSYSVTISCDDSRHNSLNGGI